MSMRAVVGLMLAVALSQAEAQGPPIPTGQVPTFDDAAPSAGGNTPLVPGMSSTGQSQSNDEQGSFIYGNVVMADGSLVPNKLPIERVCFSSRRTVAYTNAKGQFSFPTGSATLPVMTAAESADDGVPDLSSRSAVDRFRRGNDGSTNGCSVSVQLAGFHADPINLDRLSGIGGQNAGTLVLHRLA